MSGGDIAAIIAASGFVLLVLFIAIPLVKLGGVLDETRDSIRDLAAQTTPLLTEITETAKEANKQLAKVDVITTNVAEVSSNISSLVAVFSAAVGSPLVKIAGMTKALSSALLGKKK